MTSRTWWQAVSAVMVGICLALMLRYVFLHTLTILTLFALGLLIAWIMDPVLDAMERKGWKRVMAIWAITLGIVATITVGGVLVVPGMVAQVEDAATHWRDYSKTAQDGYARWRTELEGYASRKYPSLQLMPLIDAKVDETTQWVSAHIPSFLQWLSQRLIASIGLIAAGAILLVISFHFMCVIDPWRKSLHHMLPVAADAEVSKTSLQINAMLGQYLRGMVIVSIGAGLAATLLLTIVGFFFGTKYALIIGVVTGVTYVIPYLGPLTSALTAGFFGYVTATTGSPWAACFISIGAMYLVNQVFDVAITPRVVGQRVGLHPLVILFSVFVAASLFGIPGMIIATPLAASIKIILARWLPIKEMDYTAPPSKRRLNIDMVASVNLVGRSMVRLGKDLERAVKVEKRADAEQPSVTAEPPAASQPEPVSGPDKEPEKDVDTDNA